MIIKIGSPMLEVLNFCKDKLLNHQYWMNLTYLKINIF